MLVADCVVVCASLCVMVVSHRFSMQLQNMSMQAGDYAVADSANSSPAIGIFLFLIVVFGAVGYYIFMINKQLNDRDAKKEKVRGGVRVSSFVVVVCRRVTVLDCIHEPCACACGHTCCSFCWE